MEKEIWKTLRKCNVGGQALIEGVMMRNGNKMATAVRKTNGEIVVEKTEYIPWSKEWRCLSFQYSRCCSHDRINDYWNEIPYEFC